MSTIHFDRWKHYSPTSGPFKVYKQYYTELNLYYWSSYSVHKLAYKGLKSMGADWSTDPGSVLLLPAGNHSFDSLRKWSSSFDASQVWTRLQALLSMASILETYIDTIASLAIESDPGVLINASRSMDGISLIKRKRIEHEIISSRVMFLTKGTWNERFSAFDSLFGNHPNELDSFIEDLEGIRRKRNSVGHAFGRDIEQSRRYDEFTPLPIDGISEERLLHYFDIMFQVAQIIDKYLLEKSIGGFEPLFAYHLFINKNKGKRWNSFEKESYFKRDYNKSKTPLGDAYIKELIQFYNKA